jgi:hypothetical protein
MKVERCPVSDFFIPSGCSLMSKYKGIQEAEGPVSAFGVSVVSVAGFGDVRAPGCRGARISRCPCDRVSGYWGVHILGYLDAGVSVFLNLYVFECSGSRGLELSRCHGVNAPGFQVAWVSER